MIIEGAMARAFSAIFYMVILTANFATPGRAGLLEDAITARDNGDFNKALQLLHPLADQGSATAQLALGAMHFGGQGLPQSDAMAAKWFRMSAEQAIQPLNLCLASCT
jgi:TPR repeat protein